MAHFEVEKHNLVQLANCKYVQTWNFKHAINYLKQICTEIN